MLYRDGNWDKVILVKIIFFLIPIHKLRPRLHITLLMLNYFSRVIVFSFENASEDLYAFRLLHGLS